MDCWLLAGLSERKHTRTRTHALIRTTHCVRKHNIPWSFFTSFHSLFIIAPLETRSLSVHPISLCSKSMTLCACVCVWVCGCVCVCSCSVSSHAYLPLGLRTSLKMFVFMPCAGGLESNLHLCVRVSVCACVCDTVMMRGWGIPGFLHEAAADRCGRLESKLFLLAGLRTRLFLHCWSLSSFSIPLPFPHALASSSHFSLGFRAEAEIKTWILANTRRDDSVILGHAGLSVRGPGEHLSSSENTLLFYRRVTSGFFPISWALLATENEALVLFGLAKGFIMS